MRICPFNDRIQYGHFQESYFDFVWANMKELYFFSYYRFFQLISYAECILGFIYRVYLKFSNFPSSITDIHPNNSISTILLTASAMSGRPRLQVCLKITQNIQNSPDSFPSMNAFKKKPQSPPTIDHKADKLNMLLGLGCSQVLSPSTPPPALNRDLILSSAMFWDSKHRLQRIKSLVLKGLGLAQFNDSQDFQVCQLTSIQLLSLSSNKITHLQPLASLDTLLCLNLNNNRIYSLSPLEPLQRLQQLYAAHNQITHIDPLQHLSKLRVLNVYANSIAMLEDSLKVLGRLGALEELDVENNPMYSGDGSRIRFLQLPKLIRFNGELILEEQRQKLGLPTQSLSHSPSPSASASSSSKLHSTHTSFSQMCKSKLTRSTGIQIMENKSPNIFKTKAELQQSVQQLEQAYLQLDDKFQQEIVRNVRFKAQIVRISEEKRVKERKGADQRDKEETIAQLKRKVKMLKQNLFNNPQNPRKADLLRQLFELQLTGPTAASASSSPSPLPHSASLWTRKFDYDEQIPLSMGQGDDNSRYLLDEDEQLAALLCENNSALQQIKRELRLLTQ